MQFSLAAVKFRATVCVGQLCVSIESARSVRHPFTVKSSVNGDWDEWRTNESKRIEMANQNAAIKIEKKISLLNSFPKPSKHCRRPTDHDRHFSSTSVSFARGSESSDVSKCIKFMIISCDGVSFAVWIYCLIIRRATVLVKCEIYRSILGEKEREFSCRYFSGWNI